MDISTKIEPWSFWRKLCFRFFFIFLFLIIEPWHWLDIIPGVNYLLDHLDNFIKWIVNKANSNLLHVRAVLVPPNGSGDTSFSWAGLWTYLLMAAAGGIIWTVIDRRRLAYTVLNYWLCLLVRYYIASVALVYGIMKLFLMQMPFPGISQMATPLGDFLPMRLSWMFLGYSGPYQFFSGCMEVTVGLLLLYRRTVTLGTILATGVFLNVMMLNLSYDIPVKIFSLEIVMLCLFLLVHEWQRISCFFILNRPASACRIYNYPLKKRWMRIGRVILKLAFMIVAIGLPLQQTWSYWNEAHIATREPVKPGLYDVREYAVHNDTTKGAVRDSMRWADMVFEGNGVGSIRTKDTIFRQRYGRGYYYYSFDTGLKFMAFRNSPDANENLFTLDYDLPDSNTIQLHGVRGTDSIYVLLVRSTHHFQLAEKQFHWLSEGNR